METLRLFTAIDLTDDIRNNIIQLQNRLKSSLEGVKWTAESKLHLTLKFLGDVPEQNVPSVKEILKQTAAEIPPFQLTVSGLGQFPQKGTPRIIWIGLEETNSQHLLTSHQLLDDRFSELGIDRESREFHPHVTIGRVKKPDKLDNEREVFERERDVEPGEMTVNSFTLYQSVLEPEGSRYTVLEEADLNQ